MEEPLLLTEHCQIDPPIQEDVHKRPSKLIWFALCVMLGGSLFLWFTQYKETEEPYHVVMKAITKTLHTSRFRIKTEAHIESDLPQTPFVADVLSVWNDQTIAIDASARLKGDVLYVGEWNMQRPTIEKEHAAIKGTSTLTWTVNQKHNDPWIIDFQKTDDQLLARFSRWYPFVPFLSARVESFATKWISISPTNFYKHPFYASALYAFRLRRDEDGSTPEWLHPEQKQDILATLIEEAPHILTNLERQGKTTIHDEVFYPYTFTISPDGIYHYLEEVNEIAPVLFTTSDLARAKQALSGAQAMHGEIWIDEQGYVRNIMADGQYDWGLAYERSHPQSPIPQALVNLRTLADLQIDLDQFNYPFTFFSPEETVSGGSFLSALQRAKEAHETETPNTPSAESIIISPDDPLAKDPDHDGLSTFAEQTTYHTDPHNPDTDGDGYLDGEEVEAGFNPLGEG